MDKYLFILRNNVLFRGISDDEILSILQCVKAYTIKVEKDEYILRVGENTAVMGLVLSGSVFSIQEDLWGHRNIINRINAGGCFAEPFAAVPGSILNVNIIADEACEILMLNVKQIMTGCSKMCRHHTVLMHNFVAELSKKVLLLNDKITHVSKRSTREKITSFLSAEAQKQGKLSFDISFDRQQLADFLCVERAAMSVELSKLQREGLIKTNRNHFELYTDMYLK